MKIKQIHEIDSILASPIPTELLQTPQTMTRDLRAVLRGIPREYHIRGFRENHSGPSFGRVDSVDVQLRSVPEIQTCASGDFHHTSEHDLREKIGRASCRERV